MTDRLLFWAVVAVGSTLCAFALAVGLVLEAGR